MPHVVTWEDKGVYKRFSGNVSWQEYASSQEEVLSDPKADDIRYVINDFSGIESYTVTREEAEYSAAITLGASCSNPRMRIAYVTADPKIRLLIALVSVFSAYELKVFATVDEAREWASLPI